MTVQPVRQQRRWLASAIATAREMAAMMDAETESRRIVAQSPAGSTQRARLHLVTTTAAARRPALVMPALAAS